MAEKNLDKSKYLITRTDNELFENGVTSLKNEIEKVKNGVENLDELFNKHFSSLMSIEKLQLSELQDTRKIAEETRLQEGIIVDGLNSFITKFQLLVELFIGLNNSLIFTKSLVATTAIFQLIMVITLNILTITLGYVTGFLNDGTFMLINLGMSLLSLLYPAVIVYFIKHARKNMMNINNKPDKEGEKDDRSDS